MENELKNILRIKNFRSLGDVEIEIKPLTLLFGPNGTGKSSVLKAISFLRENLFNDGTDTIYDISEDLNLGGFSEIVKKNDVYKIISFELEGYARELDIIKKYNCAKGELGTIKKIFFNDVHESFPLILDDLDSFIAENNNSKDDLINIRTVLNYEFNPDNKGDLNHLKSIIVEDLNTEISCSFRNTSGNLFELNSCKNFAENGVDSLFTDLFRQITLRWNVNAYEWDYVFYEAFANIINYILCNPEVENYYKHLEKLDRGLLIYKLLRFYYCIKVAGHPKLIFLNVIGPHYSVKNQLNNLKWNEDDESELTYRYDHSVVPLKDMDKINKGGQRIRKKQYAIERINEIGYFDFSRTENGKNNWHYIDFNYNHVVDSNNIRNFVHFSTTRQRPKVKYILKRNKFEVDVYYGIPENIYKIQNEKESYKEVNYEQINRLINLFHFGTKIKVEKENGIGKILLISRDGSETNLSEGSSGSLQLIPILLELTIPKGDCTAKVVLIEQPELHLHPKLQSLLAELFAWQSGFNEYGETYCWDEREIDEYICNFRDKVYSEQVRNDKCMNYFLLLDEANEDVSPWESHFHELKNKFIIETHSEHMIRKIQIMIARGELKKEKLAIYYFDNKDGETKSKEMNLDDNGLFMEEWPDGFFDDSSNLTLELYEAISRRN